MDKAVERNVWVHLFIHSANIPWVLNRLQRHFPMLGTLGGEQESYLLLFLFCLLFYFKACSLSPKSLLFYSSLLLPYGHDSPDEHLIPPLGLGRWLVLTFSDYPLVLPLPQ